MKPAEPCVLLWRNPLEKTFSTERLFERVSSQYATLRTGTPRIGTHNPQSDSSIHTPTMTDEQKDTGIQDELTKRGRDVWLAGLGALATVEEEGSKLFSNLVDRGRDYEGKRRKELEEAQKKAQEQGTEALSQLTDAGENTREMISGVVDNALERFNVPTQKEVDKLSQKVDALSQQIDQLTKSLSEEDDA
jgi:poly(hydroxyalkanoate) granule-associated protein